MPQSTAQITDVCNMALSFLGKGRIADINENTELGRQCKLFYDYTKQQLLRDYTWGFAKRVEKLALLDEESPYWEYIYAYPKKCIAVRKIFSADNLNFDILPEQKDRWDLYLVSDSVLGIGCNLKEAWMEYTYDIEDLQVVSPDFLDAFAHMLACNIALPLTGNTSLKSQEYQLAMNSLSKAKYTTAAEKVEAPTYPNKYFTGRG